MYQNPALVQELIGARVAELRQSAQASARSRSEQRRGHVVAAARRGTGWLLVDIGLRLAVPRNAMTHRFARGQR
jgi:hypothetical protein